MQKFVFEFYAIDSGKKSRQFNFVVNVKSIDNLILTEHDCYKWLNLNELEETTTITLKKDDYPRLLADFVIELDKDKGVRVKEVDCYDNTCYKQGWVNITNLPIVCIPNDVRIVITSTKGNSSDIIIYGGSKYDEVACQ